MNSSFLDELDCITDTTDEENEDLPYDGDLGITCQHSNYSDNLSDCTYIKHISDIFLNISCSEDNKNIKAAANYETQPQPEEVFNYHTCATETTGISVEMPGSEASFKKELPVGGFSSPDRKEHLTDSKMSNVLLRHFSKGELMTTCQLIEYETIPEISFTESIDETMNKLETSELAKCPLSHEKWTTNLEEYHLEKHEEIKIGSPLISKNEDMHIFQNTQKEQRDPFKRTGSSHELKFGQGQVHYCLPDFSKVAPEVKIPKRNDNNKSVPITERTKTFPILPCKSVIVNDIVENKNYFDSVEVENKEEMSFGQKFQLIDLLLCYVGLQSGATVSTLPSAGTVEAHCLNPSNLLPELTQGKKVTQILKEQTDQLKMRVITSCVSIYTLSTDAQILYSFGIFALKIPNKNLKFSLEGRRLL
uniref:Uncharacterized protein n=1 Tax=Apteryx owenii TaxID=8824 RepID=A0A8B9P1Z9_APTOW